MQIREATLSDITAITTVFRDTVLQASTKFYSEKQINVWGNEADDLPTWENRINDFYFIVAEIEQEIVGFAYLKKGYYLDGLFVSKNFQRKGVATRLLSVIESQVIDNEFEVIKSDVYKTALPFFENRYFEVIKKQKTPIKGVFFEKFLISRAL